MGENDKDVLTTQTPAIAYFPSAALRSMTFALFWDRSGLGFRVAGSVMLAFDLQLHGPNWQKLR